MDMTYIHSCLINNRSITKIILTINILLLNFLFTSSYKRRLSYDKTPLFIQLKSSSLFSFVNCWRLTAPPLYASIIESLMDCSASFSSYNWFHSFLSSFFKIVHSFVIIFLHYCLKNGYIYS